MTREIQPTRLTVDLDPQRACYYDKVNSPRAFVFPVQLGRYYSQAFDFGRHTFAGRNFKATAEVSINIKDGDTFKKIAPPEFTSNALAAFLRATVRGDKHYSCMTFAWALTGVPKSGPGAFDYVPAGDANDLQTGELVVAATAEKPFVGSRFASTRIIKHWGVYLDQGLALNVMGTGGMLAGTPTENFPAIYSDTTVYKLAGYKRGEA